MYMHWWDLRVSGHIMDILFFQQSVIKSNWTMQQAVAALVGMVRWEHAGHEFES